VRIVRADTIDAPAEATRSEGMERSAWEPQFLAVVEREEGVAGSAPAMRQLRELVSVMRLFKEGGVGLGPHAFMPTGEGSWRKVPTGLPATRPGGFELSEAEAVELADFARRLEARPDPAGALAWAVARFEMGCDRPDSLDAVPDHLLAMRALFEGSGPVGANLPMRVAALVAEPPERPEAYEKLQGAFELERVMMAGQGFDTERAAVLATWLEDAARSVIRGAALGEHGSDVAASADESLVASGLEAGEGSLEQRGGSEEWNPPPEVGSGDEPADGEEEEEEGTSEIELPTGGEIRVRSTPKRAAEPYAEGIYFEPEEPDPDDFDDDHDDEEKIVRTSTQRDWLSEVSEPGEGETLEWPAPVDSVARQRPDSRQGAERESLRATRVRHLFEVPDDTEWEVAELDYDREESRVG